MSESKDHAVCSQCQQVRPLAEFGDDELIDGINLLIMQENSAQADCHPDDVEDCNKYYMNKIISLIRNHKSRRNQVLDKAIEAMQEFCDRRDKDEVRSTYTYNKFKSIIEGLKQ